jgi:hypothetical protein
MPKFINFVFSVIIAISVISLGLGDGYIENQKQSIIGNYDKKIFYQLKNENKTDSRNFNTFASPLKNETILKIGKEVKNLNDYFEFEQNSIIPYNSQENLSQDKNIATPEKSKIYNISSSEEVSFNFSEKSGISTIAPYTKSDIENSEPLNGENSDNIVYFNESIKPELKINVGDIIDMDVYVPFRITEVEGVQNGKYSKNSIQESELTKIKDLKFGGYVNENIQIPTSVKNNAVYLNQKKFDEILNRKKEEGKQFPITQPADKVNTYEISASAMFAEVDNIEDLEKKLIKLRSDFPEVNFYSWGEDLNKSIIALNNSQQVLNSFTLVSMAIVTIMFGIIYFFKMQNRKREVGILKLYGLSRDELIKIFTIDIFKIYLKLYIQTIVVILVFITIGHLVGLNYIITIDLRIFLAPLLVIGIALLVSTPLAIFKVLKSSPEKILNSNR